MQSELIVCLKILALCEEVRGRVDVAHGEAVHREDKIIYTCT